MIDLNTKKINTTNSRINFSNNTYKFSTNNGTKTDTVTFTENQKDENKSAKKNNLLLYAVGGLTLVAGLFLALKYKKGKSNECIENEIKMFDDLNKEFDENYNKIQEQIDMPDHKVQELVDQYLTPHLQDTSKSIEKETSLDKELKELQEKNLEYKEQIAKLKINDISSSNLVEKTIDEKFDEAINTYAEKLCESPKLKDKKALIKEIIPDMLKFGHPLNKDDEDMIELLKIITPENKDFIIKKAIPTVHKNYTRLYLDNAADYGDIIKEITPDNLDCVEKIANNKEKFMITRLYDIQNLLSILNKENKDMMFNEVIPHLIDNAEKFKISDGSDISGLMQVITPENKDFMFKEVLPYLAHNAEKFKISDGSDFSSLMQVITPGNKDFMFKEVIPYLAHNAEKFKISDGSDIAGLISVITPENKDFMLKEVMPHLADNAEKFKIYNGSGMASLMSGITPENKDFMFKEAIPEILNNTKKLEIHVADEVAAIANIVNKKNINNIKTIVDNPEKYDIKNDWGLLDIEKLNSCLKSLK